MANQASKEAIAASIAPTDWKGGLDILRNRVKAKKDHVASTNGEISALYDQIEKKGINKKGARIFLSLDGLEDSERKDVLRTVQKLAEEAGWNNTGDMVDQAEGNNVVEMPGGAGAKAGAPADEAVDPDAKIEPATFKAAIVARIAEESDMAEADAYVIANRIYDDLTTSEKKKLSHKLAVEKADDEMQDWPEVPTEQ